MTDMVASNGMSVIAYWQQRAEAAESALAASRAEVARLLKLFEFGEWIGSNDAADVVCDSTQEHLNTTEGYGLHLQYKIRLSRAEAESVLKRWEGKK
jgi:hypothetical protein